MNLSGATPEPFTSDSITVQFSSVEVSPVSYTHLTLPTKA